MAMSDQRYEAARELFAAGLAEEALCASSEVLSPSCPNAHNFAGFVLLRAASGSPDRLTRALDHFEAELAMTPDDAVPLVNLADTLLPRARTERPRCARRRNRHHAERLQERVGALRRGL